MTIAGNQGQNVYPDPDNYAVSSFPQPVPAPDAEPDEAGTLLSVAYSWRWREVLMASIDQLLNPATWEGEHDEIILALDRALELKILLQGSTPVVQTPFWDDASDVDDDASIDMQTWYGYVSDPVAPPGELTFFEDATIWAFTGLLAFTGTPAAAIAFRTVAPKFVLAQRAGDVGEIIRIVIDAEDYATIDTSGRAGEIIRTPVSTTSGTEMHDILIIKQS
jgi:hypothetical protein